MRFHALGLKFISDCQQDQSIQSISKDARRKRRLYPFRNRFTHSVILYRQNNQSKPKSFVAALSVLKLLTPYFPELIEFKIILVILWRWWGLRGQIYFSTDKTYSDRRNSKSLSLLYLFFHDKCSDALHSLLPPVQALCNQDTSCYFHGFE